MAVSQRRVPTASTGSRATVVVGVVVLVDVLGTRRVVDEAGFADSFAPDEHETQRVNINAGSASAPLPHSILNR